MDNRGTRLFIAPAITLACCAALFYTLPVAASVSSSLAASSGTVYRASQPRPVSNSYSQYYRRMPATHATPNPAHLATLTLMAFPLKTGVQVDAMLRNLSVSSLHVLFPTSGRVQITAVQNGCTLWNSTKAARFVQSETTLVMGGQEIATFAEFWPVPPGSVDGKVTLHARLLSPSAIAAKPLTIQIAAPDPAVVPTAKPAVSGAQAAAKAGAPAVVAESGCGGNSPVAQPLPGPRTASPAPHTASPAAPVSQAAASPAPAISPEVMPAPGMRHALP